LKDELGYKLLGMLRRMKSDATDCIKALMNKKEGGKSLWDVGGKNSHRLSPIHYTSIAEIKGFRFKLERSFHSREKSSKERDIKSQAGQRRSTAPF
jgi:hypothetical protein